MLTPRFSIVLPVHNGEPYIRETLDSLLAQTYQHYDIIALENQSTDQTPQILASRRDPRLRVVPSNHLLSIEENWGRITEQDLQQYVVLFCADDVAYPNFLEEIAKAILANPDASLFHSLSHTIDENNEITGTSLLVPYKESAEEFLWNFHRMRRVIIGSGYVLRRDDFRKIGGFRPIHKLLFSDVLCYYLAAKLSYKVCVQQVLFAYRAYQGSYGQLVSLEDAVLGIQDYLKELNQTEYGSSKKYLSAAHEFIRLFCKMKQRNAIKQVIFSEDSHSSQLAAYSADLTAGISATQDYYLFPFFNSMNRLYETIARLPWLRVRIILSNILDQINQVRGFMKTRIWGMVDRI